MKVTYNPHLHCLLMHQHSSLYLLLLMTKFGGNNWKKNFFFPWVDSSVGFSGCSAGIESACNAGHLGSIPGLERPLGEGSGYPLQYASLNSMNRGTWWATVHGVHKQSDRTEWLTHITWCWIGVVRKDLTDVLLIGMEQMMSFIIKDDVNVAFCSFFFK